MTKLRDILRPNQPDGAYETLKEALRGLDAGKTSRCPEVRERLLRVYWALVHAEIAMVAPGDVDP